MCSVLHSTIPEHHRVNVAHPIGSSHNTPDSEYHKTTAENESSTSSSIKKRVRTGCFNCRRKHKKCDEQKPICKACVVKNDVCQWPDPNESKESKKAKRRKSSLVNGLISETKRPKSKAEQRRYSGSSVNTIPRISNSPSNHSDSSMTSRSPVDEEENRKAINDYSKKLVNMESSLSYNVVSTQTPPAGFANNEISINTPSWIVTPSGISDQSNVNLLESNISPKSHENYKPIQNNSPLSTLRSTEAPPATNDVSSDFPFVLSPTTNQLDILDLGDLQSTFRDYMFANASEQFNDPLSIEPPLSLVDPSPPSLDTNNSEVLSKSQKKILLKNYLYKVAPWLDMFDLTRQMGLESVQLAKRSPCLEYAILALSARQLEKTNPHKNMVPSSTLYQASLKHLIPTVKTKTDVSVVSSCVMLCVFEMLSSVPGKWRYHLEGCSVLFKATGIHGFSSSFERALFWMFTRMDVNSAVIGEQATMIECEKWLPEGTPVREAGALFLKENSLDMYANYSVFLSSRVLGLISSTEIQNFDEEWKFLWDEVRNWHIKRPDQMKPLIEFESSPFPEILYDNGPAISSNQLYHMSMILLMENKPRLYKITPQEAKSPTWHAKQIVATSISNDHHGCWNNAVQNLYIAGKILTHEDEHRIILNLLDEIESTTGWAMKFRAKDLREFWEQSC